MNHLRAFELCKDKPNREWHDPSGRRFRRQGDEIWGALDRSGVELSWVRVEEVSYCEDVTLFDRVSPAQASDVPVYRRPSDTL